MTRPLFLDGYLAEQDTVGIVPYLNRAGSIRRKKLLVPYNSPLNVTMAFAQSSLLLLAMTGTAFAQAPDSSLDTSSDGKALRIPLMGNVHPLARPEFDRGEAPADLPMDRLLLVLKRSPESEASLRELIENQQFEDSADYHHWLTPAEFGERFGPALADIEAVTHWLKSSGFEVSRISESRMFVEFSGNAGLVKKAFGTPIHKFVVNGESHWANTGAPAIPAALASVVAGVDSLHDFRRKAQSRYVGHYSVSERKITSPSPAFTFGGQPTEFALVPFDFAIIYDLLPLWKASSTPITGKGQTIAIVARSDIDPDDTNRFWTSYALDGRQAPKPTLIQTYDGPSPGITADEAEADIDTQWSGATAPGATINLVISASTATTDGVDLSSLYIVDHNLAPVMSVSFGECEAALGKAGVQFFGTLWEQAAAQGISVVVSTGDNGAAGCDSPDGPAKSGLNVNGLASTPFNVAVGGTDFDDFDNWAKYWSSTNNSATRASAKSYIPETTWNDSCTNSLLQNIQGASTSPEANCNNPDLKNFLISTGGSGGKSASWPKPTWQTSTEKDNARDLPDVSLFASNGFLGSYYIVCQSSDSYDGCLDDLNGFGGTSVSAPAFAGILAMVNQKTGSPQGVPGLVLYKLAAHEPSAFHDVPAGSTISMPCVTDTADCGTDTNGDKYGMLSGWETLSGFDLATGLGSVDAANLVNHWSQISFTPSKTKLTVNGGATVKIKHGTAMPFAVNVTPAAATGDAAILVAPGTAGDLGLAHLKVTAGSGKTWTTLLPGGSCSVLAHYGGSTTYGGSYSKPVPVTVDAEPSKMFANLVSTDLTGKVVSFNAASATYGSGYGALRLNVGNATATLSAPTGISSTCSLNRASCPTGAIAIQAPGTSLDGVSLALNADGNAQSPTLPPGKYSVTASYAGDASYGPSTASAKFNILKAPTVVTVGDTDVSPEYENLDQLGTEVDSKSEGIEPTGTFQFYVDGIPVGNPVSVNEGDGYRPSGSPEYAWADASTSAAFPSAGRHTIQAKYSGDANYAPTLSRAVTVSVAQADIDILDWGWGLNSAKVGQKVTPYISMGAVERGDPPTAGKFIFLDNGIAIKGTVEVSQGGDTYRATLSYTLTSAGSHNLIVNFAGDTNYAATSTYDGVAINVTN